MGNFSHYDVRNRSLSGIENDNHNRNHNRTGRNKNSSNPYGGLENGGLSKMPLALQLRYLVHKELQVTSLSLIRIYTHIHTHTHTHTHTYIHTHTHIHTHTYIHTYIHTHIHTHTYIHTHTHIHTYTNSHGAYQIYVLHELAFVILHR